MKVIARDRVQLLMDFKDSGVAEGLLTQKLHGKAHQASNFAKEFVSAYLKANGNRR